MPYSLERDHASFAHKATALPTMASNMSPWKQKHFTHFKDIQTCTLVTSLHHNSCTDHLARMATAKKQKTKKHKTTSVDVVRLAILPTLHTSYSIEAPIQTSHKLMQDTLTELGYQIHTCFGESWLQQRALSQFLLNCKEASASGKIVKAIVYCTGFYNPDVNAFLAKPLPFFPFMNVHENSLYPAADGSFLAFIIDGWASGVSPISNVERVLGEFHKERHVVGRQCATLFHVQTLDIQEGESVSPLATELVKKMSASTSVIDTFLAVSSHFGNQLNINSLTREVTF